MPTEYDSTARSLALPVSPHRSSTPESQPPLTSWTRRRSSQSHPGCQSSHGRRVGFIGKLIDDAEKLQRKFYRTAKKLTLLQKILASIALIGLFVVGILFLVFNEKIFAWLEPFAQDLKKLRGGWLIMWALTFMTAFPPLIGYSICVTTAGFAYGFPEGWFIVASATVLGSLCSFMVSRTVLSKYVHRLIEQDTRFAALTLVLKRDGLKLLCMIRLCPLPYSISNGAISTFETVKPSTFALATAIVTPKLMIHVFIGSRLAVIARSGGKMDAMTKSINWLSIIVGVIIGALTAWLIYKRYSPVYLSRFNKSEISSTLARSRELEAEERNHVRRSMMAADEFMDDPDDHAAVAILRNDHIDFLNYEDSQVAYEDDLRDEDDDDDDEEEREISHHPNGDEEEREISHHPNGDEERAISLNKQTAQRG